MTITITIFGQYGSAPSGETWTPYVQNYDASRWTDWSNAGRQGGLPANYNYYVSIDDFSGTATQKLISAISAAHNYGVANNCIVVVKYQAEIMLLLRQLISYPM